MLKVFFLLALFFAGTTSFAGAGGFDAWLKSNPDAAKIVAAESTARKAWAEKGEYAALLKKAKAQLEAMATDDASMERLVEVDDLSENIPPLAACAEMEARIRRMTPAERERYAFCNFAIRLRALRADPESARAYVHCAICGEKLSRAHPDVVRRLNRSKSVDEIRAYAENQGLDFVNGVLICDDPKKLDAVLGTLQEWLGETLSPIGD